MYVHTIHPKNIHNVLPHFEVFSQSENKQRKIHMYIYILKIGHTCVPNILPISICCHI